MFRRRGWEIGDQSGADRIVCEFISTSLASRRIPFHFAAGAAVDVFPSDKAVWSSLESSLRELFPGVDPPYRFAPWNWSFVI